MRRSKGFLLLDVVVGVQSIKRLLDTTKITAFAGQQERGNQAIPTNQSMIVDGRLNPHTHIQQP